jgi:signal recognition particle subunit SRP54
MFETLSRGFRTAKQRLSGQAELTAANIEEALQDVRTSLLEADVEFKVVRAFLDRVKEKAIGEVVQVKAKTAKEGKKVQVTPGDHFTRICQKELEEMMGPVDARLHFAKRGPTGVMMVGLQGSGKTTTAGKLARWLQKQKKRPMLVAADVYRPAAIEQLRILGERLDIPVFLDLESKDPPDICERAHFYAQQRGRDVIIYDTAGRLAIDEKLMLELAEIEKRVHPQNKLLVVDAMIGQDAVNTARTFNERIPLDGIVLTKLDGDARGGAALAIKEVTGKPIKFLGMGEDLEKLEEFRPEGLASRILGMGDIVGLMMDFEDVVDAEKAEADAMRMLRGQFDMNNFLEQIRIIQRMGSLKDLFEKLPFFPEGLPEGMNLDDRELTKIEAMISSMTQKERRRPELFYTSDDGAGHRRKATGFNASRVRRVAKGSGRADQEVRELLAKFQTMRQMMSELGQQTGLLSRLPGFKQFSQMKQLGNLDVKKILSAMPEEMRDPEGRKKFRPPALVKNADREKERRKRQQAKAARKKNRRK